MRTKTILFTLALLLLPGVSPAQTPDPGSTGTHLVRAAGMPLADGTLPPGVLTVRVVRGSFEGDIVGQVVETQVAGGKIDAAVTGDDGRAQFAHLPVGGEVQVSATVAGIRLESDSFTVPADSGVRILLVAGDGGAIAGTGAHPPVASPSPTAAVSVPLPRGPGEDPVVTTIRAVLATSTVFALGVAVMRRRRQPHPAR